MFIKNPTPRYLDCYVFGAALYKKVYPGTTFALYVHFPISYNIKIEILYLFKYKTMSGIFARKLFIFNVVTVNWMSLSLDGWIYLN